MSYPSISEIDYHELINTAQILKQRRGLPAIALTSDNQIIKHIYHRGWWSSSTIYPYAKRIQHNTKRLQRLGIKVPGIQAIHHYPQFKCDIVIYQHINGNSVFEHAEQGDLTPLKQTAAFVAKLHQLGIFFRDIHFDNILVIDDGFSLIDLASIRCSNRPLSLRKRAHNIARLFNKRAHRRLIAQFGHDSWLQAYSQAADMKYKQYQELKRFLLRRLKVDYTQHYEQ